MEKYLICLMSLVDLSVNHTFTEETRTKAHACAYWYKQWLSYSVCTNGYPPNESQAAYAKERCRELYCGITLNFDVD